MKQIKTTLISLLLLSSLSSLSWAQSQKKDAFEVKVFQTYVRVFGAHKYFPENHLQIENSALVRITAKLEKNNGELITYFTLKPTENKSIKMSLGKEEWGVLTIISPPFQELILKVGKEVYEIPSKK